MRLFAYVILMFSIGFVLYLMGYTSIMFDLANKQGNTFFEQSCKTDQPGCVESPGIINIIVNSILHGDNLVLSLIAGAVAIGIVGSIVGGGGSFAVLYLIPLLIVAGVMNYMVFPMSFLYDTNIPQFISIPLVVLLNILMLASVVSFIRGQI